MKDSRASRLFGAAALFLAYFAIWTVIGRYWGLQHDGQLYAVRALAELQPEVFRGDLFLAFESRDRLTLFPQLLAWLIPWTGLEHAAASVTFLSTVAVYLTAWLLARQFAGPSSAWLGVGLLLVVPGWYGAGEVFRVVEPFLTSRPAAQAASLGAIVCVLQRRYVSATILLAISALLHPVMSLPTILAAIGMTTPWAERRLYWPIAASAAVLALVLAALINPGQHPVLQGAWLEAVRARSSYLFPATWRSADWQHSVLPVLTMLLYARVLDGPARRLCRAFAWIGIAGLALTIVSGVLLPLALVLQLQPWRWVWPCIVVSLLLLPMVATTAYRTHRGGPLVAALLVTAWLVSNSSSTDSLSPIGLSSILAAAALVVWSHAGARVAAAAGNARWLAALLPAVAVAGALMSLVVILRSGFDSGSDPLWVQRLANALALLPLAIATVVVAWSLCMRARSAAGGMAVACVSSLVILGAAPGAWAAWTARWFDGAHSAQFDAWRQQIPSDAEIFWPDALPTIWFQLERRSYLSRSQLAGIVFSEALFVEAARRVEHLEPWVPIDEWFDERSKASQASKPRAIQPLSRPMLIDICKPGGPDFVVDPVELPGHVGRVEWPTKAMYRYLYDCRSI